eukprot:15345384-Ditylum_brightwellii.AAC.1
MEDIQTNDNVVLKNVQAELSSVWLTLLHKKWLILSPNDIDLHPLGMGMSICRVLAAIVAKEESLQFIWELLKSSNFGTTQRGNQFISHALTALCKTCIQNKKRNEKRRLANTMSPLSQHAQHVQQDVKQTTEIDHMHTVPAPPHLI